MNFIYAFRELILGLLVSNILSLASALELRTGLECGKIQKISKDIRTFAPWTAAIFIHQNEGPPKFFTTGTIIGPSTVLAVARGPFGSALRGLREDKLLPPADVFVVVAGHNSTDYLSTDGNAQFSEVNYLEPALTNIENNELYHFMIYHLNTVFNFRSPYVKAICLLPESLSSPVSPFGWEFISSGFGIKNSKTEIAELKIATIESLPEDKCSSYFRFHYKRERQSSNVYCGVKSAASANNTQVLDTLTTATGTFRASLGDNQFCFQHGAITVFQLNSRWYLEGIVALIPGRRQGHCDDSSVYLFGEIDAHLHWMGSSVDCSPSKFSCGDLENTCVPITSVCNGFKDCPDGKDEHQLYCEAQSDCNEFDKMPMHKCGVTGNCILKSQICDGKFDCLDGSDELQLCSKHLENVQRNCPKLSLPDGLTVNCPEEQLCLSHNTPNSTITFSCPEYHISRYEYSSVTMTCNGNDGSWMNKLPLSCLQECGIFPFLTKNSTGTLDTNLPWSGFLATEAILNEKGQTSTLCSAVLIDGSFAITSAKCIQPILEPASVLFTVEPITFDSEEWAFHSQFIRVKEFWLYKTNSGKSLDLALLKFEDGSTNYNFQISPACFMDSTTAGIVSLTGSRDFKKTLIMVHLVQALDADGNEIEQIEKVGFKIVPIHECISVFGSENVPYYVFCAKRLRGSSLLPIDIGSGLYTGSRSSISGNIQLHLKGIATKPVSPVIPSNSTEKYQLFLNVEYFRGWITSVMENSYN